MTPSTHRPSHLASEAETERIHPLQGNEIRVLPEVNPSGMCFSRACLRIPVAMIDTLTKATGGGQGVFQVIPSLGEVTAGTQGTDLQAGTEARTGGCCLLHLYQTRIVCPELTLATVGWILLRQSSVNQGSAPQANFVGSLSQLRFTLPK